MTWIRHRPNRSYYQNKKYPDKVVPPFTRTKPMDLPPTNERRSNPGQAERK